MKRKVFNKVAKPIEIMFALLMLICCLMCTSCTKNEVQCKNQITASIALKSAEDYVQSNGYTSVETNSDDIVLEPNEAKLNKKLILKRRRNTLEAKPIGYVKTDLGWRVFFRYSSPLTFKEKEFFRSVFVGDCQRDIYIEHESIELPTSEIEIGNRVGNRGRKKK